MRGVLARRLAGEEAVDEWGYDAGLTPLLDRLLAPPWGRVQVTGAGRVPAGGPALLLVNRRLGLAELLAVARGLQRATGRRPRFLGIPDVDPVGAVLRRVGGALDRPEEVRTLLRAGHLVALPLGRTVDGRIGSLTGARLIPALEAGAALLPVAVAWGPLPGWWRVRVGERLEVPPGDAASVAPWVAEGARRAMANLLGRTGLACSTNTPARTIRGHGNGRA